MGIAEESLGSGLLCPRWAVGMPSDADVTAALDGLRDAGSGRSLLELGWITGPRLQNGRAVFRLSLPSFAHSQQGRIAAEARAALLALDGVDDVQIELAAQPPGAHAGAPIGAAGHGPGPGPGGQLPEAQPIPGVRQVIAVSSGKGGVGKSTVAVNLACALAQRGLRVGLLDADIYGPSQPMMMGIEGRPESEDGKTMEPMENYGVQVMSIGFLVNQDEAMIWRGPMATQALEQLLRQTNWKDLDYLIIDMPPGTGDIQLTLSQRVPMTGAVIVTTPQDIALLDAKKGIKMFEKVGVPILGIVENMAAHVCTNCGHIEHIFGADGGKKMAENYQMDYLGALPLNMQIRLQADNGKPTVVADPDGEVAGIYKSVARQVAIKIAAKAKDFSAKFPTITVSKNT